MKNIIKTTVVMFCLCAVLSSCKDKDQGSEDLVPETRISYNGTSLGITHGNMRDDGGGKFLLHLLTQDLDYTRSLGYQGSGSRISMIITTSTVRELDEGTYNQPGNIGFTGIGLNWNDQTKKFAEVDPVQTMSFVVKHTSYGYAITIDATTNNGSFTGEFHGEIPII
ncbi:MAG: hypothetical protein JXR19_07105 [Bacteroidia bacterium]